MKSKSKWSWLGLFLPVVVICLALYFAWRGDFKRESREISAELAEPPVKNRFEYDLSYLKRVDPSLVKYSETAGVPLPFSPPYALASGMSGNVFVSGEKLIIELDRAGVVKRKLGTLTKPTAISVAGEGMLVVAYPASLAIFDLSTGHERVLRKFSTESILTSVAVDSGIVFVADAGLRRIWRVPLDVSDTAMRVSRDKKLEEERELSTINGVPGKNGIEHFVIPSPYFDVAIGADGSLWVANTGRHELDNFSHDGRFRSSWKALQGGVAGFLGCCNPAHFAIMSNGSFVTAEKGVVRVKIYGSDGVFKSVVAPPSAFSDAAVITDLAVTSDGRVLVVDSKTKRVRVFTPKLEKHGDSVKQ